MSSRLGHSPVEAVARANNFAHTMNLSRVWSFKWRGHPADGNRWTRMQGNVHERDLTCHGMRKVQAFCHVTEVRR